MELLTDHIDLDGLDMYGDFARDTYMLMLVGAIASPLGPRREVKPCELEKYGAFAPCSTPPTKPGFYLLRGNYENFDGAWEDVVLPAWYHTDDQEWECSDGEFSTQTQWMPIPWLPEVWEAAKAEATPKGK